jgi:hypothetical protein
MYAYAAGKEQCMQIRRLFQNRSVIIEFISFPEILNTRT